MTILPESYPAAQIAPGGYIAPRVRVANVTSALESLSSDPDAIRRIPSAIAQRYDVLALTSDNNELTIAVPDPENSDTIDRVRFVTGMQVRAIAAPRERIRERLQQAYSETQSDDPPVVRVLEEIQRRAVEAHASDIHIEPFDGSGRVRHRVDGVLQTMRTLPSELFNRLVGRIKLLAEMDIADRRQPQDGRYTFAVFDRSIDARVASMPTIGGEKLVIRLFDSGNHVPTLSDLGMPSPLSTRFRSVVNGPQGCIIVCGPTGSGKTTTLYAALAERNDGSSHLCSVEDPVEMRIPGVAQTQVNARAGLTFASAIRAMLRQDPDVVMIGEIRDGETARLGMSAAVSGRLLLTTLHAADAPAAIDRLVELGVEYRSIATSVTAILAQRLLRRACVCRSAIASDPSVARDVTPRCRMCKGDGFSGRICAFELIVVDDELRTAIAAGGTGHALRALLPQRAYRSMREEAWDLMSAGHTDETEIERVFGVEIA